MFYVISLLNNFEKFIGKHTLATDNFLKCSCRPGLFIAKDFQSMRSLKILQFFGISLSKNTSKPMQELAVVSGLRSRSWVFSRRISLTVKNRMVKD